MIPYFDLHRPRELTFHSDDCCAFLVELGLTMLRFLWHQPMQASLLEKCNAGTDGLPHMKNTWQFLFCGIARVVTQQLSPESLETF